MVKVWVDITNSPHVLFFEPVIEQLKKRKVDVVVTARNHSNTVRLLKQRNIPFQLLGKHWGRSQIAKIVGVFSEFARRFAFILKENPDILVTHQSPYGIFPMRLFGKKAIYIFDNEKAVGQNYLAIPFASSVLCPSIIQQEHIKRFFLSMKKLVQYKGFKEQMYLDHLSPSTTALNRVGVSKYTYAVVRPEPYHASYYHGSSERTMAIIEKLVKKGLPIVLIARDPEQKRLYKERFGPVLLIPDKEVDGPSLIYYAKVVVSGGGTMTREAAILGVPAITTYESDLLDVDKFLIKEGRLSTTLGDLKRKDPMPKGNVLTVVMRAIEGKE